MVKTYNRAPLQLNTPNSKDIKEQYDRHFEWSGYVEDENVATVDQNSLSNCNNIFIDSDGILRSRPALTPLAYVNRSVVRHWTFADINVYETLDGGTYYLEFFKNKARVREVVLNDEKVELLLEGTRIYVFAKDSFKYYDITSDSLEEYEAPLYVPITKTFMSTAVSDAEQMNILTGDFRSTHLFNNVSKDDFSTVYKKYVSTTIENREYEFLFEQHTGKLLCYPDGSIPDTFLVDTQYPGKGYNCKTSRDGKMILADTNHRYLYISYDGKLYNQVTINLPSEYDGLIDFGWAYNTKYAYVVIKSIVSTIPSYSLWLINSEDLSVTVKDVSANTVDCRYQVYDSDKFIKIVHTVDIDEEVDKYAVTVKIDDSTSTLSFTDETERTVKQFGVLSTYSGAERMYVSYGTNGLVVLATGGIYINYTIRENPEVIFVPMIDEQFGATMTFVTQDNRVVVEQFTDELFARALSVSLGFGSNNKLFTSYGFKVLTRKHYIDMSDLSVTPIVIKSNDNIIPVSITDDIVRYVDKYNDYGEDSGMSKLYVNNHTKTIELTVDNYGDTPPNKFVPDHITKLNSWFFAVGNKLYINDARYDDNNNLQWYLHDELIQPFDEEIVGIKNISTSVVAIFLPHSIWYAYMDDNGLYHYRQSRIDVVIKPGTDFISSYDGTETLFACDQGIASMTYQNFVSTDDQKLKFITDNILDDYREQWREQDMVKLFKYSFWIIVYSSRNHVFFVYDTRNQSWWPMTIANGSVINLIDNDSVDYNDELIVVASGKACSLGYDRYYDMTNNRKVIITWNMDTQRLHLGSLDYYKHLRAISLTSSQEESVNRLMNFNLEVEIFLLLILLKNWIIIKM